MSPAGHAADRRPVTLVFEDVEVDGRPAQRVGVADGLVAFVEDMAGTGSRRPTGPVVTDATVVEGAGGALLPGLHDHHLHLMAMAARAGSVHCGPPEVVDRGELERRLRAAAAVAGPGRWVRAVAYDDSVAGPLVATFLDELLGPYRGVPVRVQHRSGHQWVLNSAGVALVGPPASGAAPEQASGVYLDRDGDLRDRWLPGAPLDLASVGRRLARFGITGVTDATVTNGAAELTRFERAQQCGELPQRLHLLGAGFPGREAAAGPGDRLSTGARKIVLAEHDLPGLDELAAEIACAFVEGAAIHAVSRESLVLAAAATRAQASSARVRIEHAAVAPPEVVELLAGIGVVVVTQPGFVRTHGDRYRREVDAADLSWLYRLQAWRTAGVPLAAGSDAPFGDPDPWSAMRAATERRTRAGEPFGPDEALTPEDALDLYLSPLDDPGGAPRRVVAGSPADLCLLEVPWRTARRELSAAAVRATYVAGFAVRAPRRDGGG